MSLTLGGGGSIPVDSSNPIEIPKTEAPQNQLQSDEKIRLLQIAEESTGVSSYKVLAIGTDKIPGYLNDKINVTQFDINSNRVRLIGFGDLTTDDLTEGSINKYLTQASFDTYLVEKTTDDITVGTSNLYYTTTLFNSDLALITSDDISEGIVNKYLLESIEADIVLNTTDRHSHSNKSFLDTLSNSDLVFGAYDPIVFSGGIISHLNTDGNKHVPSNASADQYDILTSGATEGSYTWTDLATIISNATLFEASPSTSTILGVQSAYINTHVNNGTSNIKHVTDGNLTYINSTIPTHISDELIHLPTITATTDQGKFLFINSSDNPEWTNSSTNIQTAGESYITASGDTITIGKPTLLQVDFIAGSNIEFNSTAKTISATQRAITSTPSSTSSTVSISSVWAYNHADGTGAGSHIPTGGTSIQYIAGDGTIKDFGDASGGIYKIVLGPGGTTGSVTNRINDEETSFPAEWALEQGTVSTDLNITHTADRAIVSVTIYSDNGTELTQLIGNAAYSTVIGNTANTLIKISSLATINNNLNIYLQFE